MIDKLVLWPPSLCHVLRVTGNQQTGRHPQVDA